MLKSYQKYQESTDVYRLIMRIMMPALLLAGLTGCIPSGGRCFSYMPQAGYYCYKGHNFGQHRTEAFKKGVRDGCRTGEGFFRRDYALSARSIEYREGWDQGRAYCKLIIPDEAKPGMRTQYQQAIDERSQH
jgi:hypothetical protein